MHANPRRRVFASGRGFLRKTVPATGRASVIFQDLSGNLAARFAGKSRLATGVELVPGIGPPVVVNRDHAVHAIWILACPRKAMAVPLSRSSASWHDQSSETSPELSRGWAVIHHIGFGQQRDRIGGFETGLEFQRAGIGIYAFEILGRNKFGRRPSPASGQRRPAWSSRTEVSRSVCACRHALATRTIVGIFRRLARGFGGGGRLRLSVPEREQRCDVAVGFGQRQRIIIGVVLEIPQSCAKDQAKAHIRPINQRPLMRLPRRRRSARTHPHTAWPRSAPARYRPAVR